MLIHSNVQPKKDYLVTYGMPHDDILSKAPHAPSMKAWSLGLSISDIRKPPVAAIDIICGLIYDMLCKS